MTTRQHRQAQACFSPRKAPGSGATQPLRQVPVKVRHIGVPLLSSWCDGRTGPLLVGAEPATRRRLRGRKQVAGRLLPPWPKVTGAPGEPSYPTREKGRQKAVSREAPGPQALCRGSIHRRRRRRQHCVPARGGDAGPPSEPRRSVHGAEWHQQVLRGRLLRTFSAHITPVRKQGILLNREKH